MTSSTNIRHFLVLLVSLLLVVNVACFYEDSDDIVALTDANFQRMVLNSHDTWLVEFYGPNCGHCRNLEPIYRQVGSRLKNYVKVGAINVEENRRLSSQYQIQGIPTIKIFVPGRTAPVDYQGQRFAKNIIEEALRYQVSRVTNMETDNLGDVDVNMDGDFVLLVSEKRSVPPMFKALSTKFPKVNFLFSRPSEQVRAALHLEKEDIPSIVMSHKEGEGITKYDGLMKYNSLLRFIKEFHGAGSAAEDDKSAKEEPQEEEIVEEAPKMELHDFDNASEYKNFCLNHKGYCVIAFLETYDSPEDMVEDVTQEVLEEYERIEKEKKEYTDVLESVMEELGENMGLFSYFSAKGPANADLCDKLNLSFGFPAVIALHHRSNAYTVFAGDFTVKGLKIFLKGVEHRRTRFRKLAGDFEYPH